MILSIFMVIVAVVCAFMYNAQRETNKHLEELRMEILSEQSPVDLCFDDEHWELFRNELAAELLKDMMRDEKVAHLNEEQMAEVCYKYADALCNKLRWPNG